MTRLSVNVNKIATLRNARGGDVPNLLKLTRDIINFGADGITVHPRPDERHITYQDTLDLSKMIKEDFPLIELNIEGFPSKKFIELIGKARPHQITLVPDSPDVLTSNKGWDVKKNKSFLSERINQISKTNNRVCLFINPDLKMLIHIVDIGADSIELFTGEYSDKFGTKNREKTIQKYINTANKAFEYNLGINAGHDLNLDNLQYFAQRIKNLDEVSIGHSLICDSLYYGIENTIQLYKRSLI
tara:strand:- start:242 stop:973 length:732 start_codon:yes stop_codon:yes gene_type:complete